MKEALIVFAKRPAVGRVKTRLTSLLSEAEAAALYEAFLGDALEQYDALGADVRVYVAPGRQGDGQDVIHPNQFEQHGADLGERMLRAFSETFAAGHESAAIVGTDHPTLPSAFIEKAFELLETPRSVVLGPAKDGGYYLLGMNDLRPELFRGMSYSHDAVFDETVARAAGADVNLSVLPPWYDVDTPEQLERLARDLSQGTIGASRTRAVMRQLGARYSRLPI